MKPDRPPLPLLLVGNGIVGGMEQYVLSMIREMRARRQDEMKNGNEPAKEKFPGAVPTDEKLVGLLRQFIRPTHENETVDRVLNEVKAHIKDNPDLKQQAIDGWTRVLHFGDRYGTPYSRKVGVEFLASLKEK